MRGRFARDYPCATAEKPGWLFRAGERDQETRNLSGHEKRAGRRMKIVMEDGTEGEVGPGDAAHIAPGHDAWTVGDEACVAVDFGGSSNYAKRQ